MTFASLARPGARLIARVRDDAPALPWRAVFAVWLAAAAFYGVTGWGALDHLGSADDVMRLVEVRALLGGQGWFDLTEPRMDPPGGYVTHWSRLLDAPIGGLMLALRPLLGVEGAERAARGAWPLLLLAVQLAAVAGVAHRLAGARAATLAAAFGAMLLGAVSVFTPGNLDHHNAQVTLGTGFVALALNLHRDPRAGPLAVLVGALALAVGLESAYLLALALGYVVLRALAEPEELPAAARLLAGLALATAAAHFAGAPGTQRWAVACDRLGMNYLAGILPGGLGVALALWAGAGRSLAARGLLVAGAGVLALALMVAAEPACLGGPMRLMDPRIFPLWLDPLAALMSPATMLRDDPGLFVLLMGYPLAGLAALILGLKERWRDGAWCLVAACLVVALVQAMGGQFQTLLHANWLAAILVAVAVADGAAGSSLPRAALAALVASPLAVFAAGSVVVPPLARAFLPPATPSTAAACVSDEPFRRLAALPPGLVMGDMFLAPDVLARTHHTVLAGPYHRADEAVALQQTILAGPTEETEAKLRARGVAYVLECAGNGNFAADPLGSGTFRAALLAGRAPAWLEPLDLGPGTPMKAWRVRP